MKIWVYTAKVAVVLGSWFLPLYVAPNPKLKLKNSI